MRLEIEPGRLGIEETGLLESPVPLYFSISCDKETTLA